MIWKMFLDRSPWRGSSKLFIRRDRAVMAGEPEPGFITFSIEKAEPMAEGVPAIAGAAFGDDEATAFLQAALDCAWDAGLRPAGFADTGREVSALRDHLHDMRALVYADGSTAGQAHKEPPPLPSEKRPK